MQFFGGLESVGLHERDRLIELLDSGALVLDGDTLRTEANSEKRMDRVPATLSHLDPEMTVLDAREAAELR